MAAEREEVVVHPDGPRQAEHFGKDRRKVRFERRQRRNRGLIRDRAPARLGKCAAVHFPAPGERQGVEHNEGGRHHVIGQPGLQGGAQSSGIGRRGPDDIADEPLVVRVDLLDRHCGVTDASLLAQRDLDLSQFYPHAAQLYLAVDPAHKLDRSIRAPAAMIAGRVEP
jgi:hypothetical protein